MEKIIKDMIQSAVDDLFVHHPDLNSFPAGETNKQWNICHHLANEIHQQFPWFDCDVKFQEAGTGESPKIVLHRRGRSDFDFLEINTVDGADGGPLSDETAEETETGGTASSSSYRFGASVRINGSSDCNVSVYRAGSA